MREESILYGELVVLGTDGELPNGNRGRRRSRFQLRKRPKANGVRPVSQQTIRRQHGEKMSLNQLTSHTVTYTLDKTTEVIVRYDQSNETDMFQVGRSTDPPIDMVLVDIQPGSSGKSGSRTVLPEQSTLSRFACRILCDRQAPHAARIYAAGFDSQNQIRLGDRAPKWERGQSALMDGLTTNGVLIHHPEDQSRHQWRELSVSGDIYALRQTRSHPDKGEYCPGESNILRDGTLIDLCGATLLWRSSTSIQNCPKSEDIAESLARLNGQRVQCPVGMSTLNFRHTHHLADARQPFVYLKCGHVFGRVEWGEGEGGEKTCPMCRQTSQCVALVVGRENAFHTDSAEPKYTFNPCGHTISEATARKWSQILLPHGTQLFRATCPFCAIPLDLSAPFIRLIYQNMNDDSEFIRQ